MSLDMNPEELKKSTKNFAIRIIKLIDALPKNSIGKTIGNQLLRAGTSVGANYRAACRAKSNRDFIYKINVVDEEADETMFWLELIIETELIPERRIISLLKEADELTAIFTATGKSAKMKKK
jgi:four helix bundle protein